jgi:hypothetical protein
VLTTRSLIAVMGVMTCAGSLPVDYPSGFIDTLEPGTFNCCAPAGWTYLYNCDELNPRSSNHPSRRQTKGSIQDYQCRLDYRTPPEALQRISDIFTRFLCFIACRLTSLDRRACSLYDRSHSLLPFSTPLPPGRAYLTHPSSWQCPCIHHTKCVQSVYIQRTSGCTGSLCNKL